MRFFRYPLNFSAFFGVTTSLLLLSCCNAGTATSECIPVDDAPEMPVTATEYAEICREYVGVAPVIDCGDGVPVPITVDGVQVFQDPGFGNCDNPGLKGCSPGSRVGRIGGADEDGNALPDVVWGYFCRSGGTLSTSSVQMIGYNEASGATCFFESTDNFGSDGPNAEYLSIDDGGDLSGVMPAPGDPDFDNIYIPAPVQCVECHQTDPFIHNPWIDGARLPDDPSQPAVPEVLGLDTPYFVVGGADWDMRTVHIEGNGCLSCHPAAMGTAQLFEDFDVHVNDFMPPSDPGGLADDYAALLGCHQNGPKNTPGCEWVVPDSPYCAPELSNGGGKGYDGTK